MGLRLIIVVIYFCCFSDLNAQKMSVRLYARYDVSVFEFSYNDGGYTVYGDTILIGKIGLGDRIIIDSKSDSLVRIDINGDQGKYSEIRISQDSLGSSLQVKSISPSIKRHTFQDNFIINSNSGFLKIINDVEVSNYLAGVIESEGGGGRHLEYYKVQALISRTYVLKHMNRHMSEGYNVCDAVHCQAYHNMMRHTPSIIEAVRQTRGEVIVDHDDNMLSSYFHANCGGQTSDGSYVWRNSISYCLPFIDTFCLRSRQSTWTQTISKRTWENYLSQEFNFPLKDKNVKKEMYHFDQPYRKAFYVHPSLGVPLRDIRSKFNLKSTFFDVSQKNGNVILSGRGFGHGVGMCQEGAMHMAKRGYSYEQIAKFYFDDIRIMKYEDFLFYKGQE